MKFVVNYILCFCCLSITLSSFAQGETINPFDILHRLDKDKILITKDETSNQPIFQTISDNPFEVYDSQVRTIESINNVTTTSPSLPKIKVKPIAKPDIAQKVSVSYIFWILIGLLVYLAIIATLFRQYLGKIFKAFFNENISNHLLREWNSTMLIPYFTVYSIFIFTVGILTYLLINYYSPSEEAKLPSYWIWYCIGAVGGLIVLKHLVLQLIGFIFPIYKSVQSYIFTIGIFNQVTGLILLPFVILITFVSSGLVKYFIYLVLLILFIIYIFRTFRGLIIGSKFLVSNKFHFFMYLCTIEIAPIILLLKLILFNQ